MDHFAKTIENNGLKNGDVLGTGVVSMVLFL